MPSTLRKSQRSFIPLVYPLFSSVLLLYLYRAAQFPFLNSSHFLLSCPLTPATYMYILRSGLSMVPRVTLNSWANDFS